jgi:hypothetical protein
MLPDIKTVTRFKSPSLSRDQNHHSGIRGNRSIARGIVKLPLISFSPISLFLFLMGNTKIIPRERHNPVSVAEASSPQDERASMTRTNSVTANASGLEPTQDETTQDETTRYLPKGMNRSNHGVSMPLRPHSGPSTAGGIESPQWGWYINTTPPTPDMYHGGSRPLHKKQDSSANASQASSGTVASESSTATSHQPNRIFQDMQDKRKGASMGWSSVPL